MFWFCFKMVMVKGCVMLNNFKLSVFLPKIEWDEGWLLEFFDTTQLILLAFFRTPFYECRLLPEVHFGEM